MSILLYIVETILIAGLLSGYYALFLRNRRFHGYNRLFILFIPILSFLLPALRFQMPAFWRHASNGSTIRLLGVGQGKLEEAFTIYANGQSQNGIHWPVILWIIYIVFCALLLFRTVRSVFLIVQLRRNNPKAIYPDCTIYMVKEKGTPFSFFGSIFWSDQRDLSSDESQVMLRHELYHVKQNHSADLLFLEICCIISWFNPVFYFLRQELKAVHEYGADQYASRETDKYNYAGLLVSHVAQLSFPLTNPFFKNQIKRRIRMLTTSNTSKKSLITRMMALPLLLVLIAIFSFKIHSLHPTAKQPIRVVIDAGHGGEFTGTTFNGVLEKNLNLMIAKKIQALAPQYNVEVIMSRESDITPGASELRKSLEYLAGLPASNHAELFVSIHVNSRDSTQANKIQHDFTGVQIYIPRNSNKHFEQSQKFGSAVTQSIKSDFTVEQELKQAHVYVLNNATVPALVIECGYLDNPSDLKLLQDEKYQEKMAKDILEGIQIYSANQETTGSSLQPATGSLPPSSANSVENQASIYANTDTAVDKVEELATYPGGQAAWYAYLSTHLTYPAAAVSNQIQGTVVVKFIVHTNGTLSDIKAISGPESLQAVSVKTIKDSGKWTPAKINGSYVDSYSEQPIIFTLEPNKKG